MESSHTHFTWIYSECNSIRRPYLQVFAHVDNGMHNHLFCIALLYVRKRERDREMVLCNVVQVRVLKLLGVTCRESPLVCVTVSEACAIAALHISISFLGICLP